MLMLKHNERLRSTLIFAFIIYSLLLTSCRQQPSPTVNNVAENSPQIILRTAVPKEKWLDMQALAESFNAEHPNIRIQLLEQDDILSTEPFDGYGWATAVYLKLAQAADVFFLAATPAAVQAGTIHDLDPLFTATDSSFQTDFPAGIPDAFRWDAGLWSLPTGFNHTLLYYNKGIFDAANVPYPTNDWTWSQFMAAAESLTVQNNGDVAQWGFLPPSGNHAPLLVSSMETDLTTQQLISPALFTMPQFEAALDAYRQFFPANGTVPDPSQAVLQQINAGEAAMWLASALQYEQFSKQVDIGVVALPTGKQNKHTTPLYATGLSMSAGTLNPDAAWEWMRFLSDQAVSRALERQIPARQSVANASGAWDNLPPELAAAVQTALAQSYPANFIFNERSLDEVVVAMVRDGKSAADVLQTLSIVKDVPIQPTAEVSVAVEETAVSDAIFITYVPDSIQYDLTALRNLAKEFARENPAIQVNILSGTEFNSYSESAQAGHCFESRPNFAHKEVILPLDPFIETDNLFDTTDFYPGLLADFQQSGVQWGIPASADIYVIKYNKELFDQAGIPYPQNGWRTDEFLETALALTSGSGDNKIYGFTAGAIELGMANLFLEPLGARLIDESVDPPTMHLDSPETIDAIRWLTDLSKVYEITPAFPIDFDSFFPVQRENEILIASNLAAMWLELGSTPDDANPVRSEMQIGSVALPIGPEGSSSYLTETGFFISANNNAAQSHACWQWITYLSHQPTAVKEAPARRSVIQSESFRQLAGTELASAYNVVLQAGKTPTVWSRTGPGHWLWIGMNWPLYAYQNIINSNQPVEEAMIQAQDSLDQYRTCIINQEGYTDRDIQYQCFCELKDRMPPDKKVLFCGE